MVAILSCRFLRNLVTLVRCSYNPAFFCLRSDNVLLVPTPKRQPEYAHTGSLDGSDRGNPNFTRPNPKRYGEYVARAPPSRRPTTRAAAKPSRQLRNPGQRTLLRLKPQKRFAVLDPLMEGSVQRSLSQQERLSRILTPTKVHQYPHPSSSPPINRSERRSLSRFTKELERYCVAAGTNGRPPPPQSTPTVSESPTTLDTVVELAPYHKQFRAAGLAVTSREQMTDLPDSKYTRLQSLGLQHARQPVMTRYQVDGSTVTPSEQDPSPNEPAGPAGPVQGQEPLVQDNHKGRPSTSLAGTGSKSFVPWLRRKDQSKTKTTHGDRKFSQTHIHPSEATTAEPLVTPLGGIIDSYFDLTRPAAGQNREFGEPKISVTAPPSAAPSTGESPADKPLPKQPQIERRPVPPRKERRHMEDTSQWPTAGVVIHDKAPTPTSLRAGAVATLDEPATTQIKDSDSARSWTTEEEVSEVRHQTPSLSSENEKEQEEKVIEAPKENPPVPPKCIVPFEDKPDVPPKPTEDKQSKHQAAHCMKLGKSLHNQWHKAAALRRGKHDHKHMPISSPVPQETQISQEKIEDYPQEPNQTKCASSGSSKSRPKRAFKDGLPELPFMWQGAAKSSSSFEKALDAVIQKLDAMEDRRQYERKTETEEHRKSLAQTELPDSLSKITSSKPPNGPSTETQHQLPESKPSSNDAAEQSDRNISDKDVLLGLKMAICAACDEDLDAWIRNRTGLRLRRFLADLKSFDSVSSDRRPLPTQPLSRQIRRSDGEDRRLQAEKARRRRPTKKAPWAPCFGADGQVSVAESSQEALVTGTLGQSFAR